MPRRFMKRQVISRAMPQTTAMATPISGSRKPTRERSKKDFSGGTSSTSAKAPPMLPISSRRHQLYGRATMARTQRAIRKSVRVATLVSALRSVAWSARASE